MLWVRGLPTRVNRDDCHCFNCPTDVPQECHLYWAISTPEVHCNHNCPRWTIDMDTEPNFRTASYQGSNDLPPLGSNNWREFCIDGGRGRMVRTASHKLLSATLRL